MDDKKDGYLFFKNALKLYSEFSCESYCIEYLKSNILYYSDAVKLFKEVVRLEKDGLIKINN